MRQLRRETPDTKTAELETRTAALERRFIGMGHAWAAVELSTDATFAPLGGGQLHWDTFMTNAPLTFWTNTDNSMTKHNTTSDTRLVCAEYGVYVVTASVEWEDSATDFPVTMSIDEGRQRGYNLAAYGASSAGSTQFSFPQGGAGGTLVTGDVSIGIHEWWDYLPTQPANWGVSVLNLDPVNSWDVTRAFLAVVLLPNGQRELDYTVY